MYYLQSRYYDPEVCRFINADEYASTGQGFLGHNMFAYCNNNPVIYKDVKGNYLQFAIPALVDLAVMLFEFCVSVAVIYLGSEFADRTVEIVENYKETRGQTEYANTEIAEGIPDIAGKYKNKECVQAASAVKSYLQKLNQHGAIVIIQYPAYPGYIYSKTYDTIISENGMHQGVLYNNIVYCNVHPYGLPLKEWLNDFEAVGTPTVTMLPF